MRTRTFETEVDLAVDPDEAYAFFSAPRNLADLTPPALRFRFIVEPPPAIVPGASLWYLLSIRGFPVLWMTRIVSVDPPRGFVDRQIVGPYLRWIHRHSLDPIAYGTRVRDRIAYAHAGGAFLERRLVRPDLEAIFEFRRTKLLERFGPVVP